MPKGANGETLRGKTYDNTVLSVKCSGTRSESMLNVTCFGIKNGYKIDEFGNVYSDLLKHNYKMIPREDEDGYLSLQLVCTDGVRRHFRVHRLVAGMYLENPNNYPIVMHKDNDVKNNHYTNLEWGTNKMNTQYAYNDGLCSCNREVLLYKGDRFIKSFMSVSECARYFNYTVGSVTRLIKLAETERLVNRGRMKGYKLKFRPLYKSVTTIRKE